jgi:hypothetical protein
MKLGTLSKQQSCAVRSGTFVYIKVAPRIVPLLSLQGLLGRRAATYQHSVFDHRREQSKLPFGDTPSGVKPGSCTSLEEQLSVTMVWDTYFVSYFGICESTRSVQWSRHCILQRSCNLPSK